jgi:hypothetical protein
MTTCTTPPKDKNAFVQSLGRALNANYGKKRFYSIRETRDTMKSSNYPIDFFCWGHAVFCNQTDFKQYHDSIGEACDQAAMKIEMGDAFSGTLDDSWFGIDLSWLEWPDIDISSIFDFTP